MNNNASKVTVAGLVCDACGTDNVEVFHPNFPEMRVVGNSPKEAAEDLAVKLRASLDTVSEPFHRQPVREAIADVDAFLSRVEAPHAEPNPDHPSTHSAH